MEPVTEKARNLYLGLLNKAAQGLVVLVSLLVALVICAKLFEHINASQILIVQSPLTGKLNYYSTAGVKFQGLGTVTVFRKMSTYEFENPVRFNEGGHGTMVGSVNWEMPLDSDHLKLLYEKFGNQEAIQRHLIEVVVNKAVYMTGPLMSSKESYAEKRTSLISYIEDQIANGVYRTTQKDIKSKDPITGSEKTVTVVEIVKDEHGQPERQEEAVLQTYGIHTSNFAVTKLPYDETVESQIKQQQEINMKVQTAIAAAKEAEQNAITVAKQGEANAASAKWEQEVIKAKAVTEAEQQLEVATLQKRAAEQNKLKNILEGEGEATKRRLIMSADGALQVKVNAWLEAQRIWADAVAKQKWVPEIQMGASTKAGGSSDIVDLLTIKTAKELGLDMGIRKAAP
jgi:hypothetical protein